eukprot:TRINITY_DN777_c0_g1_i1.p1 TRINITY_DN777_c0_g1~~TRINITY_DN777_c0_g1_i1.p1  ORF type:complete len:368 (+),score=96.10 TRINITY_DN777_c0_g1_i1:143-1246(+)
MAVKALLDRRTFSYDMGDNSCPSQSDMTVHLTYMLFSFLFSLFFFVLAISHSAFPFLMEHHIARLEKHGSWSHIRPQSQETDPGLANELEEITAGIETSSPLSSSSASDSPEWEDEKVGEWSRDDSSESIGEADVSVDAEDGRVPEEFPDFVDEMTYASMQEWYRLPPFYMTAHWLRQHKVRLITELAKDPRFRKEAMGIDDLMKKIMTVQVSSYKESEDSIPLIRRAVKIPDHLKRRPRRHHRATPPSSSRRFASDVKTASPKESGEKGDPPPQSIRSLMGDRYHASHALLGELGHETTLRDDIALSSRDGGGIEAGKKKGEEKETKKVEEEKQEEEKERPSTTVNSFPDGGQIPRVTCIAWGTRS